METKQETDENVFAVSLQRESGNINAVRLRHSFVRSGTCEKKNDPYHQQFTVSKNTFQPTLNRLVYLPYHV